MASNPVASAAAVPSDTTISLTFSAPVSLAKAQPTLNPVIGGSWVQSSPKVLQFNLDGPLIPASREVVTVPGGRSGIRGTNGSELASTESFAFNVAPADYLRLQQVLAQLDYLPLSFTPTSAAAPKELAIDQQGTFAWRWANQPAALTSLWSQGSFDEITRAAVEAFESNNGLGVDGIAGPAVWASLLNDLAAQKVNPNPYVYVLVNKVQPENLTLWDNGAVQYSNILVNTGAPGADTTDGTYAVFEHVKSSEMKGTNPDGSKYGDPNVPWASYFNGGDALHGYIRASYGFPQSNGCVEMSYANAATIWPLTPIGTLVTVEGPASPPLPTTTTTSTTAPGADARAPTTPTTLRRRRVSRGLLGRGLARPRPASSTRPADRTQPGQAVRHVVGLGVDPRHALEELPGPGHVAGSLVQIGQQVPLADMAVRRVAQGLARAGGRQHGDGGLQIACLGQRRRRHQSAFGQHVGLGRAVAQLDPEVDHLLRLAEGPLAVHEDRDVLGGVGHVQMGLQVPLRLAELARAVRGQAGQFPHGRDRGHLVDDRLDRSVRILVTRPRVRPVGRLGLLDQPFTVQCRGDIRCLANLCCDLHREGLAGDDRLQ